MATETYSGHPRSSDEYGAPPAGAPGDGRGGHSFIDFLVVLAEHRRAVVLTTVACTVISVIVAFLLPNQYTSTVVLMPPHQESSIASAFMTAMGSLSPIAELAGSTLGIKNPNDMYVAMLKSQTVEDAMVEKYNLEGEYHRRYLSLARKAFEDHVTIKGNGKDGLIHIAVEDRGPQRAAELASGYVNQFRDLSEHLAVTEAGQRAEFFHQQLLQAKNKLSDAEEALKQTQETTGLVALNAQAAALIESAASLRAQIAAKKVQIQALQTFATGENAQLLEAEQELASLQIQLDALGGSRQNPNSLIVPKGKVPEAGLEYARRLRDVKYYETIFTILARQYEIAKLQQAQEGAEIQVVDPAIVPDRKSSPHRGLIILGGALFGLFLGMGLAVARAGIANLKTDPDARAQISRLRRALGRRS
ncbi:MAG TPA: GNVR domain-containing protein [Acidobacteriaceae bacterium]|nr:GNVR domain-containing protein [Acidobacteriaceae bacterium]